MRSSGLALLIVDDDERIRELAATAAQRCGRFASIVTADNGRSALNVIAADPAQPPDVILTDLSMPEMDGLEFARAVRADPRCTSLPIVMFSSSDRPNDREDSLGAGCLAFFEKPATLSGLQALIAGIPDLIGSSAGIRR